MKKLREITATMKVPYAWLEHCAKLNASGSLDMHDPKRSHATLIEWGGCLWIDTGSVWQGRYLSTKLRLVVPLEQWQGPANDVKVNGFHYYTGGRLTCKGKVYVMTNEEVELVPE
jgi:hypothetical protein